MQMKGVTRFICVREIERERESGVREKVGDLRPTH